MQRHVQYVKNRAHASLNYYKRKNIVEKHRKDLQRKNYKELKRDKESKAGEIFSRLCKKLFADYYHKLKNLDIDFAFEMQEDYKEDFEDIDQIFEKELWVTGISNFSCDCEKVSSFVSIHALTCKDFQPESCKLLDSMDANIQGRNQWCIKKIDDSQWGDIIEKAMNKRFKEETYKSRLEEAKKDVEREMKLTHGSSYSSLYLPSMYFDADNKSQNTAFRTLFLKEDKVIYENSYESAIRKWQKRNDEKDVEDFLIEELESSGVYVAEKITEIFKHNFPFALAKEFSYFKKRVPVKMRFENKKRKEWALKKIENIKLFEGLSMNKEKEALIANAELQVDKIYENYDMEITDAFENYDVPFEEYLCFTKVVDLYPGFDGPREDPFFQSPENLTDDYAVLHEKLYKDIEIRKGKCVCNTCTNKLYLTSDCERILRQRKQEIPFRTCPLCQKNIPPKWFDENGHFKRDH